GRHSGAELPEALRSRAFGQIRAAHLETEVEHHFGDTAHSRSADADEMHAFDLVFHAAASTQTSATSRAASGLPNALALRAISSNFARVNPSNRSASRRAVNSLCGSSTPAPASLRNFALPV